VTAAKLNVQPLEISFSFRNEAYNALKRAITQLNIYERPDEIRLDERQLAKDLGVSRTPIREAMTLLEQEGLVRTMPRRGVFVVRKTKNEILEMITVWAALESMAARLITQHARDEEIRSLRKLFANFATDAHRPNAHIDEYSETNITFHQALIRMSGCQLLADLTDNLFLHMRAIRARTIGEANRAERSIIDHMNIIEALEARDTERAERLVRQHTLDLATHVEKHVNYLD
jgi:DNA-binding GntR family transcriptional regulator